MLMHLLPGFSVMIKNNIWVNDMDFVLATNNMKKLAEMQRILAPLGVNIVTAKSLGTELPEVEETGTTFAENAELKAQSACDVTGLPAIADDSGLCVDYLNGAPGVYSARFSGEHGNDEKNNDLLLEKLAGVPENERTAHYACAVCCIFPDGKKIAVEGKCYGKYTAEEKDKISHRGNALRALKNELEKVI